MPPLAQEFALQVSKAIALAEAGDIAATASAIGSEIRKEWHISRVELLYELAYLRMFTEWELFLEQTFIRYLCGYRSSIGLATPKASGFSGSLPNAEFAVLGTNRYVLWHNPDVVIKRAKKFFTSCTIESVIGSNSPRLLHFSAIRHCIVHSQKDAKNNFDIATMNFCGRRYRGSRPGRFLRDWDRSLIPRKRWLEVLGSELTNLAPQIA